MKKIILGCVSLIFVTCILFANDNIPYFLSTEKQFHIENKQSNQTYDKSIKKRTNNNLLTSAIERRPYDVLSYDVFLDWYNVLNATTTSDADRYFTAKNTIVLKIDSASVTKIELDSKELKILSVSIDGIKLDTTPQSISYLLDIPLPSKYKQGDTLTIAIDYQYVKSYNVGFFLYPKGYSMGLGPQYYKKSDNGLDSTLTQDSVLVEEKIAYTMNEPEDASYWLPCNNRPYDKAFSSIAIRVPLAYNTASNGLVYKIDTSGDAHTYYWKNKYPTTTYLMTATSSIYVEFNDWYKRTTNPDDSIMIKYFVWKRDYDNTLTDGIFYNARDAFRDVPKMMENFSNRYIEYPYEKYGMVAVQRFGYGGMENQTLTMINRDWMRKLYYSYDDKRNYSCDLENQVNIAHELAHQWLGDLITCATWNDIWINEGGAMWSQAFWGDHLWNGHYADFMVSYRNTYIGKNYYTHYSGGISLSSVYGYDMNDLFNFAITYCKAGWVYYMLENMLGKDVFLPALRNMLKTYAFQPIETEDFKNFLKQEIPNPPISLETFLNQWIYMAGHPIYDINSTTNNHYWGSSTSTITIKQTQSSYNRSDIPDVFIVPLTLLFTGSNSETFSYSFINDTEEQTVIVDVPFFPKSIKIDTTKVLCDIGKNNVTVSVNDSKMLNNSDIDNIYPNPIIKGHDATLQETLTDDCNVTIDIIDLFGNIKQQCYNGYLMAGNYNFTLYINDLPSGAYFVRSRGNSDKYYKLIVIE